jgi:hypothetical protein
MIGVFAGTLTPLAVHEVIVPLLAAAEIVQDPKAVPTPIMDSPEFVEEPLRNELTGNR